MKYVAEKIADKSKQGYFWRIADENDDAVATTYDSANAQLLVAALSAYGMSSRQAVQTFG
jgi:hypothetical protein